MLMIRPMNIFFSKANVGRNRKARPGHEPGSKRDDRLFRQIAETKSIHHGLIPQSGL